MRFLCLQTSSSESAEASINPSEATRRTTILSCPFSQYRRTPRLAKPVSIPTVPGVENKKKEKQEKSNLLTVSAISVDNYAELDFEADLLEGSRRTSKSTTSLASSHITLLNPANEIQVTISTSPTLDGKLSPEFEDQKGIEASS